MKEIVRKSSEEVMRLSNCNVNCEESNEKQ